MGIRRKRAERDTEPALAMLICPDASCSWQTIWLCEEFPPRKYADDEPPRSEWLAHVDAAHGGVAPEPPKAAAR